MIDDLEAFVMRQLIDEPTTSCSSVVALVRKVDPLVDPTVVDATVTRVVERARGFGALAPLLADPDVTELMVNGPGSVFVERSGRIERSEITMTAADVAVLVERILRPLGLRVDRLSPCVDARLPDGSRVNVVVAPVALHGPVVTVRRFDHRCGGLDRFGPVPMVELLRRLVSGRVTMLVVGGTGAGKTSLLNALAAHIDPSERVITIEDTAELTLPGSHVVGLESRSSNGEGVGAVTVRDLVRNSLRMRPDRLVIGEVRGGEALDLLLALNTGHRGSLATCHANDSMSGLKRLETLALLGGVDVPAMAIRDQLVGAIDVVVHVVRAGARRRVASIAEVCPESSEPREIWPRLQRQPVRPIVEAALRERPHD